MWPTTFLGEAIEWPSLAELAAGMAVRQWLAAMSRELRVRLRLLDRQGLHPSFGIRVLVPRSVDLLQDPRIPIVLRGASNVSGNRDAIAEDEEGNRLTLVLGEGLYGRIHDRRYDFKSTGNPDELERLERSGQGLAALMYARR
jgi:hypothetical protein